MTTACRGIKKVLKDRRSPRERNRAGTGAGTIIERAWRPGMTASMPSSASKLAHMSFKPGNGRVRELVVVHARLGHRHRHDRVQSLQQRIRGELLKRKRHSRVCRARVSPRTWVGEAIGQSTSYRSNVEREARVKSDDVKSP